MNKNMQTYAYYLDQIEAELMRCTSEPKIDSEQTVVDAMRYSLLSGGKRVRPVLTLAVANALGSATDQNLLSLASAIEMIHAYSLIHDDLPAMDNDDLRRGKPTNHIVYGEGMAVLAGDGLLNLAYEELFDLCKKQPVLNKACLNIAHQAGVNGMIGGQSMDMTKFESDDPEKSLQYLIKLQKLKTGGLIKAATLSGYYFAEAMQNTDNFNSQLEELFIKYADRLGLAFQIRDDLLDVISNEEKLGKTIGKDARDKKLTFVTLLGVEGSKEYENRLYDEIVSILNQLEKLNVNINFLSCFTSVLMRRDY
ncbi:MAG TPA: polyprenyl synthetase family protein [Clostridiaceae bacterium]|nr:polyprenyl synthetase family protein [Clostridiaceae bacterium]